MIRNRTLALSLALAAALVASMALAYGPRTAQRFAGPQGTAATRGPVAGIVGGSHADLATLLGMSEDALVAERQSGKTVADLLVEHGLTTAGASATLAAQRDARIDAAVAAGTLDAQRAVQMKSRTPATIAAMLTREPGPRAGAMVGSTAMNGNRSPMGAQAQRGAGQGWQSGNRGGPGMGIHQPGTRLSPPNN
jgi:hypothetical protein